MTVSVLIDYLSQFPDKTKVVMSEEDAPGDENFIALDTLDYSTPEN